MANEAVDEITATHRLGEKNKVDIALLNLERKINLKLSIHRTPTCNYDSDCARGQRLMEMIEIK